MKWQLQHITSYILKTTLLKKKFLYQTLTALFFILNTSGCLIYKDHLRFYSFSSYDNYNFFCIFLELLFKRYSLSVEGHFCSLLECFNKSYFTDKGLSRRCASFYEGPIYRFYATSYEQSFSAENQVEKYGMDV